MKDLFWKIVAKILARPMIANWLIEQARKTPYLHLRHADGTLYMGRWWLANPYARKDNRPQWSFRFTLLGKTFSWAFPYSMRIHFIATRDEDRAMHDHPWNARTILLKGWYREIRDNPEWEEMLPDFPSNTKRIYIRRDAGDTATLKFNEYHAITEVAEEGVYTLFISSPWVGDWGFRVDGRKVYWRDYLGLTGNEDLPMDRSPNVDDPLRLAMEKVDAFRKKYGDRSGLFVNTKGRLRADEFNTTVQSDRNREKRARQVAEAQGLLSPTVKLMEGRRE